MKQRKKTQRIAFLALFTAIIIIQNFIPFLGYIPLGPLNLTIIHITVIVAALVLGPKDGALVGGVWGMITFIRAFVWPTSPLATTGLCFAPDLDRGRGWLYVYVVI